MKKAWSIHVWLLFSSLSSMKCCFMEMILKVLPPGVGGIRHNTYFPTQLGSSDLVSHLSNRGAFGRGPCVGQLEAVHQQLWDPHQFYGCANQCRSDDIVHKERSIVWYKNTPGNKWTVCHLWNTTWCDMYSRLTLMENMWYHLKCGNTITKIFNIK